MMQQAIIIKISKNNKLWLYIKYKEKTENEFIFKPACDIKK